MGMLPGVAKIKDQLNSANLDDKFVKRQRAIISSMTPLERRNPDLLKASRKKRIAAGSGVNVEQVNRLLKQHRQMADMMKMMGGAERQARHDGQARADDGHGRGHADADARADRGHAERDGRRRGRRLRGPSGPPGIPVAPPPGAFNLPPQFPGLGSAAESAGSGRRLPAGEEEVTPHSALRATFPLREKAGVSVIFNALLSFTQNQHRH